MSLGVSIFLLVVGAILTFAVDHAGLGGIYPQDRHDAGHRAGQQGRCAAEPPVKLLRDKDLVGAF